MLNITDSSSNNLLDFGEENGASEPTTKQRKTTTKGEWTQFEYFRKEMQINQEKKFDLIQRIVQKSPEKSDLELFFNSIFKTVQKFTPKDQAVL